jgi:hypothetical protein
MRDQGKNIRFAIHPVRGLVPIETVSFPIYIVRVPIQTVRVPIVRGAYGTGVII